MYRGVKDTYTACRITRESRNRHDKEYTRQGFNSSFIVLLLDRPRSATTRWANDICQGDIKCLSSWIVVLKGLCSAGRNPQISDAIF